MSTVLLALGSNIGDRAINFETAIELIGTSGEINVVKRSSFYMTRPVGGPPQDDYLNGVVEAETSLSSSELLSRLKDIEKKMGRKPARPDSPRIIDIDILFFDNERVEKKDLIIPHPRLHKRGFVLKGLVEIAPEKMHPVLKKTVRELAAGNLA